jgi:hypothetical protein
MKLRLEEIRKSAVEFRPIFDAAIKYAPNRKTAEKARMVKGLFNETFGPPSIMDRVYTFLVSGFAFIEHWRAGEKGSVMRQPFSNRVTYPDRRNAVHDGEGHLLRPTHHREQHKRHHSADIGVGS